MRGFVRSVSVVVLTVSSIALALGILELAMGDSSEKAQAIGVLAGGLFGELAGGISWLLVDVAESLNPTKRPRA
jgi:hypothetical protein